jgi:endogenous inhibitor of DNA gyrase (YacG/DUF329 family)
MSASPTCPICKKAVAPRPGNQAFPFCGPRCKMVDLGKWLNEDYRVPTDDSAPEDPRDGNPGGDPADVQGSRGTGGEED